MLPPCGRSGPCLRKGSLRRPATDRRARCHSGRPAACARAGSHRCFPSAAADRASDGPAAGGNCLSDEPRVSPRRGAAEPSPGSQALCQSPGRGARKPRTGPPNEHKERSTVGQPKPGRARNSRIYPSSHASPSCGRVFWAIRPPFIGMSKLRRCENNGNTATMAHVTTMSSAGAVPENADQEESRREKGWIRRQGE